MTGEFTVIVGSAKIGRDVMINVKRLPKARDITGVDAINLALGVGSVRIGSMLPIQAML